MADPQTPQTGLTLLGKLVVGLLALGLVGVGGWLLREQLFPRAAEPGARPRLEGALTTDIAGKKNSHAIRLDQEAEETLKKAQIHKKVATVIFFESNGGQTKNVATVPEIRLGVAEPHLDIGNVETALEALTDACYYLGVERNQYRFSLKENLNKRFADRKAGINSEDVEKLVLEEIQKVFPATEGVERIFFPQKSGQVPDKPAVNFNDIFDNLHFASAWGNIGGGFSGAILSGFLCALNILRKKR